MIETMWVAARFPDGTWTSGGSPDAADYKLCTIYMVHAESHWTAIREGKRLWRNEQRRKKRKEKRKLANLISALRL